jgi:peroxiredoxin
MNGALTAARLGLAVVFLVAGLSKLSDPSGARRAVREFGVSEQLLTGVAWGLPLVELGVAAALVPTGSARWGAVAALALLLAFSLGIAVNLRRGNAPECHCFGQLTHGRMSWRSLLRNVLLAGAAGLIASASGSGDSVGVLLGELGSADRFAVLGAIAALTVVALEWRLLVAGLASHGRALLAFERVDIAIAVGEGIIPAGSWESLPIGSPAPRFALQAADGGSTSLDEMLSRGRNLLLLFTEVKCPPCMQLLPEVARWQAQYGERATVAVIARGGMAQNLALASEHRLADFLVQEADEVSCAYRVTATPSAVFVRADGTIGSGVGAGADAIRLLLAAALRVTSASGPLPRTSWANGGAVSSHAA